MIYTFDMNTTFITTTTTGNDMNKKQLNRKLKSINIQRDIGYTYSTTLEELKRDVWNACKKNGFEFVRAEYAKTMNNGSSSVRIICRKPNPSSKQRKGEFLVSGCTAGIAKRGILKGQKTYGIIYSCDMLSAHEINQNRKRYSEEFINAIKTIETKYPTLGAEDREEWKRSVDALCSIDNPRRHFKVTNQ